MPDGTPTSPLVVADGVRDDIGRKGLVKRPIVAVPLVLWLFAWSFWALWGIFVPIMVLIVGRNPRPVWKEIAGFLQYVLRVTAYLSLTVEPFPGYRNRAHEEYPVGLSLEYPEHLSRWLALMRILLNGPLLLVGFVLIIVSAGVTLVQLVAVLVKGRPDPRIHGFQVRLLGIHARTFAFLLSLTDEPPFKLRRRGPLAARSDPGGPGMGI